MADIVVLISLAGIAVALTSTLLGIKVGHYSKSLPELHQKTSDWLDEIEAELEDELKMKPKVDEVLSIAGRFSTVKSIKDQFEQLQRENSFNSRTSILVYLTIVAALFVNIFGSDSLSKLVISWLASALWFIDIVIFYRFHIRVSDLERKTHFKKVEE